MVDLTHIFEEFSLGDTKSSLYGTAVSFSREEYPTIPHQDVEPVSIIEPDLEKGPWIAGGAALRWYQSLPVGDSDIDVFCANALQAKSIIERIKSWGRFQVKYESDNAVTLQYWTKDDYSTSWIIQIITRRYFASMQDVISSFDLSVCEIGTCGTEWLLGPNTARDIRERNLRFKYPLAPDAAKRLIKYWVYGYRPINGTIESIQNNPNSKWQFALDDDYNNAF